MGKSGPFIHPELVKQASMLHVYSKRLHRAKYFSIPSFELGRSNKLYLLTILQAIETPLYHV